MEDEAAILEVSDLLTTTQVGKRLRVSPSTVTSLRRQGKIKYIQIGRKVMYTPESISEFIAANTTQLNQGEQTCQH